MISTLKILSAIFVWLLPIGIFIRDWKFKDARTKLHFKINIGLLIIGVFGALLSSYFIIIDESQSKENLSRLESLQNNNDSLLTQNIILQSSIDSMNFKNDKLNNSNIELIQQNEILLNKSINLISKIDNYQSEIERQKNIIESLKDYSWNASLGIIGNPPGYGPASDIQFDSDLTNLIKKTCTLVGDKVHFNSDPESQKIYKQIVDKYPKFPFGYYYLAYALSKNNDPSWKKYAEKAVEILKKTTIIDGHNPDHDDILKMIQYSLQEQK